MKISKSSWHYRLIVSRVGMREVETNLCNYFWQLLISLVLAAFGVLVVCFVVFVFLLWIYQKILSPLESVGVMIMFAAVFVWFVFGITSLVIEALSGYENRKTDRWLNADKEERSLLVEMYIAHKKNICPLLEFKE